LGDGTAADVRHSKGIISKLYEKDKNGELLIDVVLVILDGASRDLGTSYELINKVIIPNLGDTKRLIIGINQADQAMKGRNWDSENSKPLPKLQEFLKEEAESVKRRIKEGTGVSVEPICYSAGYKEEGQSQEKPYNLSKLLYYILMSIPEKKRLPVLVETNDNKTVWESDDGLQDYSKEIRRNVGLAVLKDAGTGAAAGAAAGAAIGSVIPVVGTAIGAAVGAVAGAFVGAVGAIADECFITTATCQTLEKGDDCFELTTFRAFRDDWLVKQTDGKELVTEYYEVAPKIVSAIDRSANPATVYHNIWNTYLSRCLADIEAGDYPACKSRYIEMVNVLRHEYSAV
jgi:predicted GTPase